MIYQKLKRKKPEKPRNFFCSFNRLEQFECIRQQTTILNITNLPEGNLVVSSLQVECTHETLSNHKEEEEEQKRSE